MEIMPLGLGYLDGAKVVTVTLGAKDASGYMQPIQAQWPADDLPEFASLLRKAIEQVGGDLALKVDDANAMLATSDPVAAPISVDLAKDAALQAVVNDSKQALLDQREAEAAQRESERLAAENALEGVK